MSPLALGAVKILPLALLTVTILSHQINSGPVFRASAESTGRPSPYEREFAQYRGADGLLSLDYLKAPHTSHIDGRGRKTLDQIFKVVFCSPDPGPTAPPTSNLLKNPRFQEGLSSWQAFGESSLRRAQAANYSYGVSYARRAESAGPAQIIRNLPAAAYELAIWVKLGAASGPAAKTAGLPAAGRQYVNAMAKIDGQYVCIGGANARPSCWTKVIGGFTLHRTAAEVAVYIQGATVGTEILVTSASLLKVDTGMWRQRQNENIKKKCWKCKKCGAGAVLSGPTFRVRLSPSLLLCTPILIPPTSSLLPPPLYLFPPFFFPLPSSLLPTSSPLPPSPQYRQRDVTLRVHGAGAMSARVQIDQVTSEFPFGANVNGAILYDKNYQRWFLNRFNWAVFNNEAKWYFNEQEPGVMDYNVTDALVQWFTQRNIKVRAHNIFWAVEKFVQTWVKGLNNTSLWAAMQRRMASAVTRYRGKVQHWDVINEPLHGNYYGQRLGGNVHSWMFKAARAIDPNVRLFLNEYNTVEQCDKEANPEIYLEVSWSHLVLCWIHLVLCWIHLVLC
ncbi:unnamed protein product [Closterium sp. NIES-54]